MPVDAPVDVARTRGRGPCPWARPMQTCTYVYVWMYVCMYVHANSICIHAFPSQIEIVYNKQKLLHGDFEITPPIRQGILMPKRTA